MIHHIQARLGSQRDLGQRALNWVALAMGIAIIVLALVGGVNAVASVSRMVHGSRSVPATATSFPRDLAEQRALGFAFCYLEFPAGRTPRSQCLGGIQVPAMDDPEGQWGWLPASGANQGPTSLYVAAYAQEDQRSAMVTVSAEFPGSGTGTDVGKRVWLAVRIVADQGGRLSVAATPAFVAAPPGTAPVPLPGQPDSGLDYKVQPVLKVLFDAYASGDSTTLASVGTSSSSVPAGLDGTVRLDGVQPVQSLGCNGQETDCTVIAPVVWVLGVNTRVVQPYQVHLVFQAGVWRVASLQPV